MHQVETHLRTAIAAVIRAQAEAEVLGIDGLDHDLFLLRLELQRIAQNPRKYSHRATNLFDLEQELPRLGPRYTARDRAYPSVGASDDDCPSA